MFAAAQNPTLSSFGSLRSVTWPVIRLAAFRSLIRMVGALVFHAEVHGSPFFVVKNAAAAAQDGSAEPSLAQVAQATVACSRAGKDGLSSADAYWVRDVGATALRLCRDVLRRDGRLDG